MQTTSECARLVALWLEETERRAAGLLGAVRAHQPSADRERLRRLKAIEAASFAVKEDAARLRPDWTDTADDADVLGRLTDARTALKSAGARLLEAHSRAEDLDLPMLAFAGIADVEAYVDLQFRALEAALAPLSSA